METMLKLAHDLLVSGHQAVCRTNDQITLDFSFPGTYSEEQGGFRRNWSTEPQILSLRLIAQETLSKSKSLNHCFRDFKMPSIQYGMKVYITLTSTKTLKKQIRAMRSLNEMSEMDVKTKTELSKSVKATIGSRQGTQCLCICSHQY